MKLISLQAGIHVDHAKLSKSHTVTQHAINECLSGILRICQAEQGSTPSKKSLNEQRVIEFKNN